VNLSTSFYYSWDWFQNISNYGMGNFIDDEFFCYADTAADAAVCESTYVDRAVRKIGNKSGD
jgi:hypothetical protein